jgi:microcystin degradation protein MlrC
MISVKCASAWRSAFGNIAADQCYVDTPGICSSNVERMPYTRLAKAAVSAPGLRCLIRRVRYRQW